MGKKKDDESVQTPSFGEALEKFERDRSYVSGKPFRPNPKNERTLKKRAKDIELKPFRDFQSVQRDSYFKNSLQKSVLKRLKRGNFPILATCDLHGFRFKDALYELTSFLKQIENPRMSTVLIIHGKGLSSPNAKPVLKPLVKEYLMQQPKVLAFMPAPKNCGGDGATLVLLKRSTQIAN